MTGDPEAAVRLEAELTSQPIAGADVPGTLSARGASWSRPTAKGIVFGVVGLAVTVAAIYPRAYTSLDPNAIDPLSTLAGPSWRHLLGTDEAGADLYTRIVYATRLEMIICLVGVAISYAVAVPAAVVFGRRPGFLDEALAAVSGGILAFPVVLLGMLVVGSFGASAKTLIIIFAIAFFPQIASVARAQTKSIYEREFVVAARASGVREAKILATHVLPNIAPPLLVLATQLMAVSILAEAALSYLGLGIQPPSITWGALLLQSKDFYRLDPVFALVPGIVVTVAAGAFLLAGDLLSGLTDVRRRRR